MNQSFTDTNSSLSIEALTVSNQTSPSDPDGLSFMLQAVEIAKYFYIINFCIGLFGNSLSFLVLGRKSYLDSTNAINLRFLAAFDLISITVPVIYISSPRSYHGYVGFCLMVDYVYNVTTEMSNWTLVVLTVQRVVAVFIPHRVRMLFTKKRNYILMIGLTIFFVIVDAQDIFFMHHIDITACYITYPSYLENVKLILDWFNISKLFLLPFLFIAVGNTIMIYNMRQRQKWRENLMPGIKNDAAQQAKKLPKDNAEQRNENLVNKGVDPETNVSVSPTTAKTDGSTTIDLPQTGKDEQNQAKSKPLKESLPNKIRAKQDRNVTTILIVLNVCFLILKLPHEIQYIYFGLPPSPPTYQQLGEKYLVAAVAIANNSCNFFLYVLFGSKFRCELKDFFKDLIKCCKRK